MINLSCIQFEKNALAIFCFRALVQSKEIQQLMDCLLGEESITLDTKWVRVLAPKEATDTHAVTDDYEFDCLIG